MSVVEALSESSSALVGDVDAVLGRMTHQMRRHVGVVTAYTELVRDGIAGDVTREQAAHLGTVLEGARELDVRLGVLSDAARVALLGDVVLTTSRSDLADVCRTAAERACDRTAGEDPRAMIELQAPDDGLELTFDRRRIEFVVSELLANALARTPSDGFVGMTVDLDTDRARVVVEDTGPGIPTGAEELVFEPFTTFGERADVGVGLGLYVARAIARAHGGDLRSVRWEGTGSAFVLELPLEVEAR